MVRIAPRTHVTPAATTRATSVQATTTQTATTTTTKPTTTTTAPLPSSLSTSQAVAASVTASLAALASTDPTAAATKKAKLAFSPFSFFRGTVEIFAAQNARTAPGASVLLNGDVHPMNFGCVADAHGKPVLALNDFDEAARGPFSYDVKRGAAGFALLCDEQKLSKKQRADVVEAFVDAYAKAVKDAAKGEGIAAVVDVKHADGAVKAGLEKAEGRSRKQLLDDAVDSGKLKLGKDLKAAPQLVPDVAAALSKAFGHAVVVKDVVEKTGAGIGSLGARRLLVLIEGPSKKGHDDVLLELKSASPSALSSQSPSSSRLTPSSSKEAARVVKAAAQQTRGADPWSASTSVAGTSFVVRERAPARMPLDLFTMDKDALVDVARACGAVLAGAHVGADGEDLAERIVKSMGKKKDFVDVVTAFAGDEADRTRAAWQAFTST